MSKKQIKTLLSYVAAVLLLCALTIASLNIGSIQASFGEIVGAMFGHGSENADIIIDLRLPRILVALLGGTAIAVSGVLLQAVLRNPLADPGIIGVSSGASLVAVILAAFLPGLSYFTPLLSCFGGLLAFALVYSLSWKSGLSPIRIILVGVAVSSMFTGIMSAFDSGTGSSYAGAASIVDGNITLKSWSDVYTLLAYVAIGLILAMLVANRCNLLALSDQTATSLGVNVNKSRIAISLIGVVLASIATSIMGPISFLGLIVPHVARLLVGSNHKVLIPY